MKLSKSNYGLLITARNKSKRLKNKLLLKINKKTIFENIIFRYSKIFKKNKICLITSNNKNDDILVDLAKKNKINYFRGFSIDVLKRIFKAAEYMKFDNFVSLTADNPYSDPYLAKKILHKHLKNNYDFSYFDGLPNGLESYVLKTKAVEKVILKKKNNNTEIWGGYFMNNSFKVLKFNSFKKKMRRPDIRLTLDDKRDYKLLKKISKIYKTKQLYAKEIIDIFCRYPDLMKINNDVNQRQRRKYY